MLIPENALRGRWLMQCKHGRIEVFVTLAPTVPPRIQYLHFTGIKPLSRLLKKTISQVINVINSWDKTQSPKLFARNMKPAQLERQFAALRLQYGTLKPGEVLEGDGQTQAQVRLIGKRGIVDMKLQRDPKTGKVSDLIFMRPREAAFVP
jgi:hypothetical protein